MADCLYNGVKLPKLPDWDKTTYPYAVIYGNAKWLIYGASYVLQVSDQPIVVVDDGGTLRSGTNTDTDSFGWYQYKGATDGNWEFYAYDKDSLNPAIKTVPLIWSNHDILNEDGTLYLAASEPTPVAAPALDPLSLFMGWKAGNWVARQRGKKAEKTPVAYLYNGVRLPDINAVWTDEVKALYPYAYMYEVAGFGAYMIVFASFEMYKDGKQIFAKTAGEAIYAMYIPGSYDDWESDGIAQEVKANEITFDEEAEVQVFTAVSWTSHDILNSDGTIYLAASEPVPVYA